MGGSNPAFMQSITLVGEVKLVPYSTIRLHGMSWGVKATCFKAPGVSLGGSGVSIGGVRSLRVVCYVQYNILH